MSRKMQRIKVSMFRWKLYKLMPWRYEQLEGTWILQDKRDRFIEIGVEKMYLLKNRECEVNIKFDLDAFGPEHQEILRDIEDKFAQIGITFDTGQGADCGDGDECKRVSKYRSWELDWSLSGPVRVFFRRYTKDNPKNRYTYGKGSSYEDWKEKNDVMNDAIDGWDGGEGKS